MSDPPQRPRLIPVLDVMNGVVVRAVGGDRNNYRPVRSPLTSSTVPTDIAQALLRSVGADELYIADLDAITGSSCVTPSVEALMGACAVPVWLDAGTGRRDVLDWPPHPNLRPVVGFETCRVPEVLAEALLEPRQRPVAFSLDLRNGQLLGNWRAWGLAGDRDALALTRRVVDMGVRTLIVLDLARVGTGTGTGTDELVRAIRAEFSDLDLIAGGGVRTWSDVERLGEAGATGVLVASALHEGTLVLPSPTA
ncbi:HisA/HisF-related TIM barrel protein [Gemmata sp. JC717]|uniref:HisA/HisF-related TIM barrel protein n=1 Tax=Gemmata algarum TaxID=2975278 RepID=UPI0021BAEC12|nr:HisA/HisF-related TIM barrel protein [Gemmata algarum]MDY3551749.1 HisA/HisF-related TIM barrel protein [Gemmata algarum]